MSINDLSWLNGKPSQSIAISDRGLLYGDGFFTTIKVIDNKVHRWPLHLERISFSCLGLGFYELDANQLYSEITDFIQEQFKRHGKGCGIIRLTLTRGTGKRGYKAPSEQKIQRILTWSPLDIKSLQELKKGVKLSVCDTPISINKKLAGIKHLNRLDQVIASNEIEDDCFDGLMLANNFIVCGTKSNVYFYLNDRWLTPKLKKAGVNGSVRRWLLDTQENVHESKFGLEILKRAEYCLVSNAIIGIIPVVQVADTSFKAYPNLHKLQKLYEENSPNY